MRKSSLYFGKETKKAKQNFPFPASSLVHKEIIYALAEIKWAAALAHKKSNELDQDIADAITESATEVRNGLFDDQFILPGLQGGAGTSINMSVNEVIAIRASQLLDGKVVVHVNDHVNKSQSTNDVNPSALKIASLRLVNDLNIALDQLIVAFENKIQEFKNVAKLGRTHLQDAVPTTIGEEFGSYQATIVRGKQRINAISSSLYELNLGGTAIGNSINVSSDYKKNVYQELAKITGFNLRSGDNLLSQTSSQTDFVALSQALVALLVDLSKIASDLRLLSSGPRGGFGEISMQELQSGSSIMPGKVNPVLPETVNQLYFLVSGNNLTIEHAAHASQLELGVMFPILADRLLTSFKLSKEVIQQFATICIPTIQVNRDKCKEHLEKSTAYATLLTPVLGYDQVSELVKESLITGKTLRNIILEKNLMPVEQLDEILSSR